MPVVPNRVTINVTKRSSESSQLRLKFPAGLGPNLERLERLGKVTVTVTDSDRCGSVGAAAADSLVALAAPGGGPCVAWWPS